MPPKWQDAPLCAEFTATPDRCGWKLQSSGYRRRSFIRLTVQCRLRRIIACAFRYLQACSLLSNSLVHKSRSLHVAVQCAVEVHRLLQFECGAPMFGQPLMCQSSRPKGSRVGWISWGAGSHPHWLAVWGNAVSSPTGVRGRAPTDKIFSCILEAPNMASPGTCWGQVRGGGACPPLNPPMNVDCIISQMLLGLFV